VRAAGRLWCVVLVNSGSPQLRGTRTLDQGGNGGLAVAYPTDGVGGDQLRRHDMLFTRP
jgi:hypothetical protein